MISKYKREIISRASDVVHKVFKERCTSAYESRDFYSLVTFVGVLT